MVFYQRRRHASQEWKCQPQRFNGSNGSSSDKAKKKGPFHWRFLGCNLLTASLFAGLVAEGHVRGWPTSRLLVGAEAFSIAREAPLLVAALAWQSLLEYWWHRLMHTRWYFSRMHKFHHHYKVGGWTTRGGK